MKKVESQVIIVPTDPAALRVQLDTLNPDGWRTVQVIASDRPVNGGGEQPVWVVVMERDAK